MAFTMKNNTRVLNRSTHFLRRMKLMFADIYLNCPNFIPKWGKQPIITLWSMLFPKFFGNLNKLLEIFSNLLGSVIQLRSGLHMPETLSISNGIDLSKKIDYSLTSFTVDLLWRFISILWHLFSCFYFTAHQICTCGIIHFWIALTTRHLSDVVLQSRVLSYRCYVGTTFYTHPIRLLTQVFAILSMLYNLGADVLLRSLLQHRYVRT